MVNLHKQASIKLDYNPNSTIELHQQRYTEGYTTKRIDYTLDMVEVVGSTPIAPNRRKSFQTNETDLRFFCSA